VYDMYPWDKGSASAAPSDGARSDAASSDGAPADPAATTVPRPAPAVSAVQVALDRRDNGGETAAAPGTPTLLPARQ
jgi:hypothetical protein